MNNAKMKSIESNQSGIAKKVLGVIPISQAWTIEQIMSELHRLTRSTLEKNMVQGCLKSLADSGLIKCTSGLYQRKAYKEKIEPPVRLLEPRPAKEPESAALDITLVDGSPVDRLADLASDLRGIASVLDDVALSIASKTSDTDKEVEKLRMLKALLRD